jgi:hypothetical protein
LLRTGHKSLRLEHSNHALIQQFAASGSELAASVRARRLARTLPTEVGDAWVKLPCHHGAPAMWRTTNREAVLHVHSVDGCRTSKRGFDRGGL